MIDIRSKRIGGGVTVVSLAGRLVRGDDLAAVEAAVDSLLRQGDKKVVLDVAGLDYVDSAGIGAIASCAKSAQEAGGALQVAGARGRVEQVFQAMRFESIVPWHQTLEAAAEGFKKG